MDFRKHFQQIKDKPPLPASIKRGVLFPFVYARRCARRLKTGFLKIEERLPLLGETIRKFLFLSAYYFAFVLLSVIYKLVFLALNHDAEAYSTGDYMAMAQHGLLHDFAIAGYFTAIPLLLAIITIFVRVPLQVFYKCYNALLAFITSLAFIADITLYPYWGHKLDAAAIIVYIDSPSNAVASITFTHLIILALVLITLTFITYKVLSCICRRGIKADRNLARKPLHKMTKSIVCLVIGGIIFLGIRGGVTESTNNVGTVYFTNRAILNHSAINPIFSFLHTLANYEDFSSEYSFFGEAQREEIFNGLYKQDTQLADTLFTTTRPNIITIILEGMSGELVEELGGIKGVTPNINSLSKEGVLFTNCFANSYRTDRGVLCTLSGYPSFPKTSVMKDANKCEKLPSLAASLKEAGYSNTFLYGGDINFTNMNGYLLSTGYDRLISDKDFTRNETSSHSWGAGDDITFDRLYRMVMEQKHEPWHITHLTLSSHEPWDVPYNRIKNDEKANAFAFTDEMLGKFIERLKATDKWDNTLIICIADHSLEGYPNGIKQTDRNRNHILFMLLGGAVKLPRRIDHICNQTDMAATVLAQLQLPIEKFKFSRNILSPEYLYPFAYHCYNNGLVLIDSTGFSVYDIDGRREIGKAGEAGCEERIRKAKAILQSTYSDLVHL